MSDTSIPRPEHPRPDWQRGTREGRDWINLNGIWEFDFDPKGLGEVEGWYVPGKHHYSDRIVVPFGWESHLAWGCEDQASNENYFSKKAFIEPEAVTLQNYREARRHETGWYHRTFEVPRRWKNDRVYLCCGAIDYFAKIWVNGVLVCDTESGYLPIEVDITGQVQLGAENHLVIRAHDPNDHEQQPAGKQYRWYARTSGIWQTVWLEPRSPVYLTKARFEANIETGEVTCSVWLNRPPEGDVGLRLAVSMPEGGTSYNTWGASAEAGIGPHCTRLIIAEPRLWSPEDPYLYSCTIELLEGPLTADIVSTYFAFRDIAIKALPEKTTRYLHLNGRPVYLLGALDQSFNPWGVYTFPSDEAIRRDIELARQAGFNLLRIHIKAEEPRFLYWADRLGILVMADMPNFGYEGYSDLACRRWERTMRGIIERDANHPSIIAWCLFNETWGLGGERYKELPERQEWVRQMVRLAKALDPTRPVEDNSACLYDHVETDLNSWHFYINDYATAKEHIRQVVEQTYPGSSFNFCPGYQQERQPLLNSEYGGISASMGDLDVSWCFHFLTNELRLHEKICGYVYTELQDIEWERNGVYNYDRSPKDFGYPVTDLNRADFIALDAPPCQTVEPGAQVRVRAVASHFGPFVGDHATLKWRLELTDHIGRTEELAHGERRWPFPRYAVTPMGEITITLPDRPGLATLHVCLQTTDGELIARNWVHFHVADESVTIPGLIAIPLSAFHGKGLRSFDVGGVPEALWVEGVGVLEATVCAPELPQKLKSLRLVAELSSCRTGGGGKQTDADQWRSRVHICLAGIYLGTVELPDHPADSRGVLSHHYGFGGQYGELVSLELPTDHLCHISEQLRTGGLLRMEVDSDLPHGLSIYGGRTGRYPTGPCLFFEPVGD